ncbi:MAG: TIGR00282 family metallophosphoesterase [Spirochaetia bacterium]|nr:TIGR00282 family metallophosphoesterase [Spirochaetota bacterium]MCX8097310.1 TIGR00282 family metallophosphoesterase [Spirochaetota bacterium]MDW8112841.1 TIGR00282 family metallophosphoesterase [Spirochaetia bacterium]
MKSIRILALGDVVGTRAVEILSKYILTLRETLHPDIIIVNGENSSDRGIGITEKEYKLLISSGVDVITTGNHIWNKKDVYKFINESDRLLRPINYHPSLPGRGTTIVSVNNLKVAVVNVIGSVIMDAPFVSPFYSVENEVSKLREETNLIVVDFHAEATAEKVLMGWFLDGKVSLVFGTHTHIQTADEKILPNGTGYITDIGMCGFQKSVIGSKIDESMKRIVLGVPERLDPSTEGEFQINGVIADVDVTSGKTFSIRRLNLSLPTS